MNILDIRQTDDLAVVARKCDANFKQVSWALRQYTDRQDRQAADEIDKVIRRINDDLTDLAHQLESLPSMVTNEVGMQLSAMDIPTVIEEEVESQMQGIYPPLGSYVLTNNDPGNDYPGTYWQQVDSVTTDGSLVIPLWQRTVI
jgi:hypothetical protein